ncbi:hypothetical protein BKA62DRAFT_818786 [Auriculariales sp. MPI-PUGE-AT-0066]|nr:hypothetical protein BKA62DRAFT_818786 [Auriculariales sp. MPI-PUGE-AT-0066]
MSAPQNPPLPIVCTWTEFHHRPITCIAFNSSAELLALASHDGIIVIVSTDTGRPAAVVQFDTMIVPTFVQWLDKFRFWVSTSDGMVTFWQVVNADAKEIVLLDVLPFYFPDVPHFVSTDLRGTTTKELDQHVVIAFGRTIEQWGKDKNSYGWSGLGRTTVVDSEDTALTAWPLSRHKIVVVFKRSGAMLWHPCDDALREIMGWPSGQLHAAHIINPPKDKSVQAAHQYFSAQADGDSGRAILLLGNRIVVISLTCNQSGIFVRIQHNISLGGCIQPSVSSIACWGGLPILFTPLAAGVGAFDLSIAAIQQAAAGNTMPASEMLLSQVLNSTGTGSEGMNGCSHVAGVSGDGGSHVASVSQTSLGPSISLWSVGHEASQAPGDAEKHPRKTCQGPSKGMGLVMSLLISVWIICGGVWMVKADRAAMLIHTGQIWAWRFYNAAVLRS